MRQDPIQFIDLHAQREYLGEPLENAILDAVREGKYILGPQVHELEKQLAEFSGAKHCVTCANGTEALALYLMAKGVRPGDAILVPAFTFIATAEVIAWLGATPIFVDVREEDFNMNSALLQDAIDDAKINGLRPVGIIAVDLFGYPADYETINAIAERNNIWVMADAAQSYGAYNDKVKVGAMAEVTATSFFPAKPLGCYGDGGAVFTSDDQIAEQLKSLRVHGKGTDKYDNVAIGMNSRLDTVQAAVLLQKLPIFAEEIQKREKVANAYNEGLKEYARTPQTAEGIQSAWAQYTLTLNDANERAALMSHCKEKGVPTAVYYPTALSKQTAYKQYPTAPGGVPVSESLSQRVLSLPMHPYMNAETQDYIIETVREGLELASSSNSDKVSMTNR